MDWNAVPSEETIQATLQAVKGRGFEAFLVANRAEALNKVQELIPRGASVMAGASVTLDEIGFTDYLKSGQHPYQNLKVAILAEKDPGKQALLRRQSVTADYYLGSVQAIAQSGEIVSCDASGSRTGPYSYGPGKVLWVAGVNKIVLDLAQALRRVREHCVPLEDKRMKSLGYPGTTLARILIFEREIFPQRTTLVLVREKLGF